ncbi:hypothetical protein [Nitrogeniibacter aestuarii]|uniref:hypothetical protein n=1 Tax=Nitrogeniibacter aestuarii TaxID=2815343 RepID=UPI001E3813E2|nr:hypothetical protein [Nitrogeniibacter aestuarii]
MPDMSRSPSDELKALNAQAIEKLIELARDPEYAEHLLNFFNEYPQLKRLPQYAGLYLIAQKNTFQSKAEKVGYLITKFIWDLIAKALRHSNTRPMQSQAGNQPAPSPAGKEKSAPLKWPELFTAQAEANPTNK